jgi:hypothetical protein
MLFTTVRIDLGYDRDPVDITLIVYERLGDLANGSLDVPAWGGDTANGDQLVGWCRPI